MVVRRVFLAGAVAAGLAVPGWAVALEADQARAHVRASVDEVLAIVRGSGSANAKAVELQAVMARRAAMPLIARFVAGPAWRDMSGAQQSAYQEAFAVHLSRDYARQFQSYAGETVTVGGVADESRKGMLIQSQVSQAGSPVRVDWLISDRPGRVVIADIVIEGVSLLLTKRDEIAGMLSASGGDIDKLITDLKR